MNKRIEDALNHMEQRITSLYYPGYFTKVFAEEFEYPLSIIACFRYHPPFDSRKSRIHDYLLPPDDMERLDSREEIGADLKQAFGRIAASGRNKPIVGIAKIKAIQFRSISREVNIQSVIYLPLFVKASAGRLDELRGLIKAYSELGTDKARRLTGGRFLDSIQRLYTRAAVPPCFADGKKHEPSDRFPCSHCHLESRCSPGEVKKVNMSGDFSERILPDRVVKRLFDMCKQVLPRDVGTRIAFTRYRPENRCIQYDAVQFMKPANDENEPAFRNLLRENKNKITQELKWVVGGVFDTLSGELVFGAKAIIDDQEFIRDKRITESQEEVRPGNIENIAQAFEDLVFDYPFNVIMPVTYNGQLLGFIFANFVPPIDRDNLSRGALHKKGTTWTDAKGEVHHSKWTYDDFRLFQRKFFDMSVEFGPLLYHSLIFDFISGIVGHYAKTGAETIHEVILGSLPRLLNLSLACVWLCDDNQGFSSARPSYSLGFADLIGQEPELTKIEGVEVELSIVRKAFKEVEPTVVDLEESIGAKICLPWPYSMGQEDVLNSAGNTISLKSMLLIPIRDKQFKEIGLREGVYVLFFEKLGSYVFQRHSLEIMQEIGGIFNIVALGERGRQEILKKGMNAAVAAIMGRNMSHNIGSHVLSYLVNSYNSLRLEDGGRQLKCEISYLVEEFCATIEKDAANALVDGEAISHGEVLNATKNKLIGPLKDFVRNNEYLLRHLKDRMDFIATILTFVPSCSTLNYCDNIMNFFVYDIRKGDGKYNATPNKEFGIDLMDGQPKHFQNLNLILDYIALSEKISGNNINRSKLHVVCACHHMNKINVAMPGGVIGKQAFYVIVENIIRNTAKHAAISSSQSEIVFTIDFPDESNNAEVDYDKNDLTRITITDNMGNADDADLVTTLQTKCDSPIIDERNGTFERSDLGFKEMKIAAAFLRGVGPEGIKKNTMPNARGSSNNILRITRTASSNNMKGKGNLEYSFFLLKPKEVLIITDDMARWRGGETSNLPSFRDSGIDFMIIGEEYERTDSKNKALFLKDFKESYLSGNSRHRFLIIDLDDDEFMKCELSDDFLPYRTISKKNQVEDLYSECNPKIFLQEIYRKWIKMLVGKDEMPNLMIGLEKEKFNNTWGSLKQKHISRCSFPNKSEWTGCLYLEHFFGKRFKTETSKLGNFKAFMKSQQIISIEPFTGSNSSKSMIESPNPTVVQSLELIEAGITPVAIIDERFYKVFNEGNYAEVLAMRGIDVFDLSVTNGNIGIISLEQSVLLSIKDAKEKGLCPTLSDDHKNKYVFLSIHQGIIDKIIDASKGLSKSEESSIRIVLSLFKNVARYVVIHSGRGKTGFVPEGYRFLNYPELESWLHDDKHTLIQGLFGIRGR